MAPKIKVTEDEILNAAMGIVQKNGFEHLNVRDVARRIGCSVHPIFRVFESMEGLKAAVYKKSEQMYDERMLNALQQGKDGFHGMGLAYIDFARSEKNLFKLLFMSDAFRGHSMLDRKATLYCHNPFSGDLHFYDGIRFDRCTEYGING